MASKDQFHQKEHHLFTGEQSQGCHKTTTIKFSDIFPNPLTLSSNFSDIFSRPIIAVPNFKEANIFFLAVFGFP